jgi:hypothetical protein
VTRSVGLGALAVALAATGCFEARTFGDSTDAADAPLADGPAVDAVDAVDAPEVDAPTGLIDDPRSMRPTRSTPRRAIRRSGAPRCRAPAW